MNAPIKTASIGNYTVQVFPHEGYSESPRKNDNLDTFLKGHRDYESPDKLDKGKGLIETIQARFNVAGSNQKSIENALTRGTIWSPVWAYDHSGISYVAAPSNPFTCPWDSGLVCYIFVAKDVARAEFGRLTKARVATVLQCLVNEVSEYSAWNNGEVYGYVVTDLEGDEVDSCWGFIGDVDYALNEGIGAAKHLKGVK